MRRHTFSHHKPPQLPTLTDDFLRQQGDVRQCELNFRRGGTHTHTHMHMHKSAHSSAQPINRMTLAQLNLNYIAAMVASISRRRSVILSSIVPLHPSSIFHPASPSQIPGTLWMCRGVHIFARSFVYLRFLRSHQRSHGCLS